MVKKELLMQIKRDFQEILKEKKILGIMLFGSRANDMETNRSDIDICLVAPEEDPIELYHLIAEKIDISSNQYDIKFFRKIPLYLKARVIEHGIVVISHDELELYEYFYKYRKQWNDEKHRQVLSKEELISLLD